MSDFVIEILKGAAALIQEGWCRGHLRDLIYRLTKDGPVECTCYCAEGDVMDSFYVVSMHLGPAGTGLARLAENHARSLLERCIFNRVGGKYRSLTGTKGYYSVIASFNDDQSVSRDEVLAVFRDAITMAYRNSAEVPQLLLTHEVSA
jgi:hypothetical protein